MTACCCIRADPAIADAFQCAEIKSGLQAVKEEIDHMLGVQEVPMSSAVAQSPSE